MEHPSVLIESMREFQNELDAKNQIALQQLNKDIDLLNSLPPGNLPIFDNKINSNSQNLNYENVPDSYNNAPSLNLDLSSRLAEVKEFNASFIPLASEEKRRENIEALMAFARTGEDAPKTNLEANGVSSASLDALHQATLDMDNRDKEFKKSMQEFTSRLEGLQTPIDQEPTSQIPQSLGTDINEKYKSNEIFQPGTYHSNERYQSNLAQKTDPNTGRLQPSRHEHLLPTPEVPQTPYNPANWKDNAQADNIMDFKETLSKLSLLSPESNRNALDSPLDSQPKREYVPLKYEGSQELLPKFASVLSAPDLSIPDFEKKYLHPNVNTPSTFNPSRTEPVPSMFNSTKTDPTRNDYVLPSIHLLDSVRLQDSGLPPRGNNHSISTSGPAHEPQESSKAIVNALRILQDRVGKLETEKSQARLKIHDLERELDSTKRLLRQQPPLSDEFSPGRNVYSQSPNVSPTKSNSGTLDSTMKNILDARQKVDMLKERVDHVRHLTEGSQFNHATALPTNLSGDFGQGQKYDSDFGVMGQYNFDRDLAKNDEELGKYDIKRDAKRVVDAVESPSFDRILQSHSDKILKEEGAFVNSYLPSTSKNSWEKSPTSIHKSKSPERSAQDQIKQLREDILKEKEIRLGSSTDSAFIKDKLMEKLKASQQSQKKQKSVEALPTWKKPNERPRSASRPLSSHVRKRSPIDIPPVDDKSGREMPFIIGKNTGKSFSVTANLQKVFSMLKSHNPEMCSVCSKKHPTHHHHKFVDAKPNSAANHKRQNSAPAPKLKPASKTASPSMLRKQDFEQPTNESLQHILGILEQEYRDSKTQYTHLVKQYESVAESMTTKAISENTGSATLKAIGNDLRHVIQNIEAKSDQIGIIRDILTSSMSLDHKQSKNRKLVPTGPHQKRYTMDTVNSRSRSREIGQKKDLEWKRNRARSQSPGRAMASLSLLKSSLKVQNALS